MTDLQCCSSVLHTRVTWFWLGFGTIYITRKTWPHLQQLMAQPQKFLGLCPQNSTTIPSKLKLYGFRSIGNVYIAFIHDIHSTSLPSLQPCPEHSWSYPNKTSRLVSPPPSAYSTPRLTLPPLPRLTPSPGLIRQHITTGCLWDLCKAKDQNPHLFLFSRNVSDQYNYKRKSFLTFDRHTIYIHFVYYIYNILYKAPLF